MTAKTNVELMMIVKMGSVEKPLMVPDVNLYLVRKILTVMKENVLFCLTKIIRLVYAQCHMLGHFVSPSELVIMMVFRINIPA